MSDMHMGGKPIVPHLKSNQCLALDTPQETPPGREGREKKHNNRNVTLIVAASMYLHFLRVLVGSACLLEVKCLHTDTTQLNHNIRRELLTRLPCQRLSANV